MNCWEMVHSLISLTTLINLMCHLLLERILAIDSHSGALLQPLIEHRLVIIRKKTPAQTCSENENVSWAWWQFQVDSRGHHVGSYLIKTKIKTKKKPPPKPGAIQRSGKMDLWVKESATKPGELESIFETHIVEGEKPFLQAVPSLTFPVSLSLSLSQSTCTHTHTKQIDE